jgi:outer membrane protein assembly factor BamB
MAVADGMVVYLDESGILQARDAATGRRKWTYPLKRGVRELLRPVPITQGLLFVMDDFYEGPNAGDGWLSAIDVQTGQERWQLPVGDETTDLWSAEPGVADGVVFFESGFGTTEHSLSAANAAGTLLWSVPVGTRLANVMAVEGGVLFAAVSNKAANSDQSTVRVFALDAASGHELWTISPPGDPRLWLSSGDGRLYFGTRNGQLAALDEATGAALWEAEPLAGQLEQLSFSEGALYWADDENNLTALDPATGAQRWTQAIDGFIRSTPIASGGLVYVGDGNGALHALDSATGAEQWQVHTLLHHAFPDNEYFPNMEYAPAVESGVLYYSDTQYLIAAKVP